MKSGERARCTCGHERHVDRCPSCDCEAYHPAKYAPATEAK